MTPRLSWTPALDQVEDRLCAGVTPGAPRVHSDRSSERIFCTFFIDICILYVYCKANFAASEVLRAGASRLACVRKKGMGEIMAERTCFNCLYCICDPCRWLSLLWLDEEILPQCANHPLWPGQLHDVPGVPCRNYHPRPALPAGDGVRMIALTDGSYAYVDAADYEPLSRWTWHMEGGYAARIENGKLILMHREIMQPPRGMLVDHIDGNKPNNCRRNLRVCTHAENGRNKRRQGGSSSMYKGVFYIREAQKWGASCFYRGEPAWLGRFDTEVEAARAYDRKAVELFGPFARLNFPREWPPERRAQVHAQWQKPEEESEKKRAKGKGKKAKVKRKKVKSKAPPARAETRGRRERKPGATGRRSEGKEVRQARNATRRGE